MSNMYKDVGDKRPNPLKGQCQHFCGYCYVELLKDKFPNMRTKYSGAYELDTKGLLKNFKTDKPLFVCDCNDLFEEHVPTNIILDILEYYKKFTDNTFLFQTKNPLRASLFTFPKNTIIVTTIETNRDYPDVYDGDVPSVKERLIGIQKFTKHKTQITIEPIMDFDLIEFVAMIKESGAYQVNIGANSNKKFDTLLGRIRLPEPSKEKTLQLIKELEKLSINVVVKDNLSRLIS